MKKDYYFSLYAFYNNPIVILFRLSLFIVSPFLLLSAFELEKGYFFKTVGLVGLFIINELFVYYRLNKTKPYTLVSASETVSLDMVWYDARNILNFSSSADIIAQKILKKKEVTFIQEKIEQKFQIPQTTITKEHLLTVAQELVRTMKGSYITTVDLFGAYLLLTEENTKYLENKELSQEDLVNILYWSRHTFESDFFKPSKIVFNGYGAFDFFIYGWTTEIQKYALDFTYETLRSKYPPIVVGRAKEYQELTASLSKSSGNVLIVGHPGTGRSSLVRLFAYQSHLDMLPHHLSHKNIYEILTDRLLASAESQGQLEERFDTVLEEIAHSGNVALFIQNMENIFGGGGFSFDMSGTLFPYLKSGKIPVIGTTTPAAFKKFFERNETLQSIFTIIHLEEPNEEAALFMIFEKVAELEQKHRVSISYGAVKEAVSLSSSYLPDMYLPGKSITLLEDVISNASLSHKKTIGSHDVISAVQAKTKILLEKPTAEEEQILLNLESEIHKRLINQEQAVKAVATALRRLRSGFVNKKRPISVFLFLGPTGVGKTETAKALAALYFGSDQKMIRLDMSEYQTQDSLPRLLGGMYEGTYVGNTLVDNVRQDPFSLVLLDEFEKAHPRILDIFLQVFDEGRLTDNQGRTISFTNTIIIATSNAGSELVRETINSQNANVDLRKELLDYLMKNGIFRPELLNRFDEVVIYKPLSREHAYEVAKLILSSEMKTLEEKQIFISFSEPVLQKIVEEGYSEEFGARNLRRFITGTIEDLISQLILQEKIKHGSRAQLVIDENGEFALHY